MQPATVTGPQPMPNPLISAATLLCQGRWNNGFPQPSFFFRSTEDRTQRPARRGQVRGAVGGSRSAAPQSGLGQPVHRPLARGRCAAPWRRSRRPRAPPRRTQPRFAGPVPLRAGQPAAPSKGRLGPLGLPLPLSPLPRQGQPQAVPNPVPSAAR